MNKYINGKIYKIVCNITDDVYIGSTIQTLKRRLKKHMAMDCISKEIIKNGNYKIELIEDYPCNNKRELELREQYYIDNNKCINIKNAYTDRKEYNKEYRIKNKNKIKEYDKEYNIKNKDKKKEYYIKNKNNIKEYKKEYDKEFYIKNKNKVKVYHKELYYYKYSWGGNKRSNNNLLEIDINIFN